MKSILLSLLAASSLLPNQGGPYLASGIKVGEVDQTSAIVWSRLTENPAADFDQLLIFTKGLGPGAKDKGEMPTDVVPGRMGETRVRYWAKGRPDRERVTSWTSVSAESDFTHQFHLTQLTPNATYECLVEARPTGSSEPSASLPGTFKTAPPSDAAVPIRFVVTTCQAVRSIDAGADGHIAYQRMLDFDPHFFVHTGDILYYDKAPLAKNQAQARAKWNLMFAYGYNQAFHRQVSSYFMKDDHDTLRNDCWPGQRFGQLTWEQGLAIFREQVPMGEKTYRTIRWGRDVQIWMTENRDFRSPNTMEDGPEKTILGSAQKAWLKKTLSASDATYKFVITPGPIVGPDKKGKADNHSNPAFAHEGQELRDFLGQQENTFVICGDRHWQYCSKDPATGVIELGCGPINDQHSFGGSPGKDPAFHRYFSGKGGFLGITVSDGAARAEWFAIQDPDPTPGRPRIRHVEQLGAQ